MSLIVFKLLLPPLLMLAATLASRRWGEAIGGWLVGLPIVSGPVSAFLAIQYGADFAASATNGSLAGVAAQAMFSLAYVAASSHGAAVALLAALAAYAASGGLLQALPLPHWGYFAVALAALSLAVRAIAADAPAGRPLPAPRWDLPARMAVATIIVVTLTGVAAFTGPKGAGVIASVPVFGATLAIFAHRMRGAAMAAQVLRGMSLALFGFAGFFYVLGLLLPTAGVGLSFLGAAACAGAAQTVALRWIRRDRSAAVSSSGCGASTPS